MGILLRYLVLIILVYALFKMLMGFVLRGQKQASEFSANSNKSSQKIDPYEVLGVSSRASKEEIQKAYKKALSEYHPDKVAHLGEDIQQLARDRTLRIQEAYELLRV